ncbi:MAG: hypothetical protein ACTHLE_15410 [Agriterribacter sp.]
MKKRTNLIFKIVALGMISSLIWILITQFYINPNKLKHGKVRYTIARIKDFFNPSDGPRSFNFVFKVNRKDFEGSTGAYEWPGKKVGDRLIVKFLESDPSIYKLVLSVAPPDSTVLVPESGWEALP